MEEINHALRYGALSIVREDYRSILLNTRLKGSTHPLTRLRRVPALFLTIDSHDLLGVRDNSCLDRRWTPGINDDASHIRADLFKELQKAKTIFVVTNQPNYGWLRSDCGEISDHVSSSSEPILCLEDLNHGNWGFRGDSINPPPHISIKDEIAHHQDRR